MQSSTFRSVSLFLTLIWILIFVVVPTKLVISLAWFAQVPDPAPLSSWPGVLVCAGMFNQ